MLDICIGVKPFVAARTYKRRHTKRRCCEDTSITSQLHTHSRMLRLQSAHSNQVVQSSKNINTNMSASKQQHPKDLEECLQPFVTPDSQWWDWKYNSRIHYRQQGSSGPCILLVHGFGVGSFHFDQLLQKLSSAYQVWAVDLLGQGLSWPVTAPAPGEPL